MNTISSFSSRVAAGLTGLLLLAGAALVSAEEAPVIKDIDLGSQGTIVFVKGPVKPDSVGRWDKLVLLPPGKTAADAEKSGSVVFTTEGATLQQCTAADLDGNGSQELLLTLDPGSGSGGYVDFSLLTASGSTFISVWEETLKGGKISLEDKNGDKKPELICQFIEQEDPKKPPVPKTAVLQFSDGKVSVLEGALHATAEPEGKK